MIRGGVFDQVGGGFHRYAVDRWWKVPHFEKMLYDNAQLVPLLVRVGTWRRHPELLGAASQTLDFLLDEMRPYPGAVLPRPSTPIRPTSRVGRDPGGV